MNRTTVFALLTAAAVSACAKGTPEQQIVDDAAAALGGRDRILAVKTLVIEGEGSNGNLGQDMTPEATGQKFALTGYKRSIDVAGGRARTEQTRTPNFAYFQGQAPQKQVLGIDGDVAYNVAPNGNATRASNAAARDRRADLYHHPVTIVRAALDPAARLTNPRTAGNERVVDVTTANGLTFTLAIDGTTELPTRVVSMSDNANLGDVAIETSFADYQDVSGLKLPARLTTKTDKVHDRRDSRDEADRRRRRRRSRRARGRGVGRRRRRTAAGKRHRRRKWPKGIWFLAGQSHHSVLVEFTDHLMLIEAPQNDTRDARGDREGARTAARTSRSPTSSTRTITSITPAASARRCRKGWR